MNGFIEIRVRRFYTSDADEADVTPSATFLTDSSAATDIIGASIARMVEGLDRHLAGIPIADIRLMTKDEIIEYRNDEEADGS